MDKLKIYGNADLFGSINIPGAKNSALPVMVASLLSQEELSVKQIKNYLQKDMRGELTQQQDIRRFSFQEQQFVLSLDVAV